MNDLKFTTAGDYMKMNERIEELAEQANLKLDELSDDTFIPLEKFAELIVRECCKEITYASVGNEDPVFAYAYINHLRKTLDIDYKQ